jgi:O-antigen/teichoic acid export membrane protein
LSNRINKLMPYTAMRAFAPFALSVALNRGLSLISVPLIAHHLTPSDYGRFELIASYLAFAAILLTFAVPDLIFRFAINGGEQERKQVTAGIMGASIGLSVMGGLLLQLSVPLIEHYHPGLAEDRILSIGFFSAAMSPLLEVALAWLRVSGHGRQFFICVALRSVGHIGFMYLTLSHGYGLWGLVLGNAGVDAVLVIFLVGRQLAQTGIAFNKETMERMIAYGLPLVAGSVAIFILGSFNRWILALHVAEDQLAMYGIGIKVSVALAFCMQPFALWWNAQRLGLLRDRESLNKSARIVGGAFVLLALAAVSVSLTGPLVIHLALPPAYAEAAVLVPWLVAIAVLHEAGELTNAGTYAARHGYWALGINASAAAVAVVGDFSFIPGHGVMGAIYAGAAAETVRLILFALHGRYEAPVPYPLRSLLLLCAVAMAFVAGAPAENDLLMIGAWLSLSLCGVVLTAVFTGLIPLLPDGPVAILQKVRLFLWHTAIGERLRYARTIVRSWRT